MTTATPPTKNKNPMHTRERIMSFFSWLLSAEGVFRTCEIVAIVAGVLTVAALIGKDRANRIIQNRKGVEMLNLQRDVADARTKQAEAEERLENLRRRQSIRESLRGISTNFHELLKDKPVGEAVILYVSGGSEDVALANALHRALTTAGWRVPPPEQILSTVEVMPKAWATGDIVIVCPEKNAPPHANALLSALVKDPYPFRLALIASSGNNLPDARPRIVINPRQ
jgi:hypothetical protein